MDDDRIQSLVPYYTLEHEKGVLKLVNNTGMKGDILTDKKEGKLRSACSCGALLVLVP